MKKYLLMLLLIGSPLYGQRIQGVEPPKATADWKPVYRVADSTKVEQVIEYIDVNSIESHRNFRQATFKDVYSANKSSAKMSREIRKVEIFDCTDTTSAISMGTEVDSARNLIQSMVIKSFDRLTWSHIRPETPDRYKFDVLCAKQIPNEAH